MKTKGSRKAHASGRQYIDNYCLKYFQKTSTTPSGWYRGKVLNVKQNGEGVLEYLITYPNGDGQYTEWVPGESMGQALQFWLDKKDVWVDPIKHQSVGESDTRVEVSNTTAVPVADNNASSEDEWSLTNTLENY